MAKGWSPYTDGTRPGSNVAVVLLVKPVAQQEFPS